MIEIEKPKIDTEELSADGQPTVNLSRNLWREDMAPPWATACGVCCFPPFRGVAVTSIKIDGVLHEFSTIPGVKEDVTEIVLNIKGLQLNCTATAPRPLKFVRRALAMLQRIPSNATARLKSLNPEMHIATLGGRRQVVYGADLG